MPSQLHESRLLLFRNQPTLAAELIRGVLGATLPPFREARVVSADLTDIQPAEYRADMVIQLADDAPVHAIVVEVQLAVDNHKHFVWPAYVVNLRARLKCPVSLLVVAADESVASWAARRIELGGFHQFTPYVLRPSCVPEVTDEAEARENPELAVLSAMAHGRDADSSRALEIARVAREASITLDADRSRIYVDLIYSSLAEAAREALRSMDIRKYEYQSDFVRGLVAQGRAEGYAALITQLLTLRFGAIDSHTRSCIQQASVSELEVIAERLLTASTLQDAVAPR
jgi:hypothetical protein